MKIIIRNTLFTLLAFTTLATAARDDLLHNEKISPGQQVTKSYNFDRRFETIVCTDDNPTPTPNILEISWTDNNQQKTGTLPITLKDLNRYDGEYADENGKITITNNSPDQTASVTCIYKEMRN